MVGQTKCSQVGRNIETASGARDDVMHFEAGLTPASLAAPAITSQDECPQSPVAPRGPASGC